MNGEPLDFDHIPRYGVWRWDGRRYQCSASGDDLAQLQQFYGVPDERIFRIDAAKKLGVV